MITGALCAAMAIVPLLSLAKVPETPSHQLDVTAGPSFDDEADARSALSERASRSAAVVEEVTTTTVAAPPTTVARVVVQTAAAKPSTTTTAKPKPTTTTTAKPKATTTTTAPPPPPPPPPSEPSNSQTGKASWYDHQAGTCAHRTLAFGTILKVTNLANGKSTTCRVADRGPYIDGRVVDLDRTVFSQLASTSQGVIDVRIEW